MEEDKLKPIVVDTSLSPYSKLKPVAISSVKLQDNFWKPRIKILKEVTLPTQYEQLEKTGHIFNFQRASGKVKGEFQGFFFNDSDLYKWIEAVSYYLAQEYDERLNSLLERVIGEIESAQDEDGYLNTYFVFEKKNQRWENLRDMHELYCAGHLIQAAIAHYRATKSSRLLKVALKLADHIDNVFGPNKKYGAPGHPEIEMALVELFRLTRDKKYLRLSEFFIDQRGHGLIGGRELHIDHKPFRELDEIVGHAVRSVYLNCGAADIYMETGEEALLKALERLWENMTEKKMYITGGIGSRYEGESFGENYELPNEEAYCETCASIANIMWNWRMLLITGDAKFSDLIELTLYNAALAGISLDGKHYFYVNPLESRKKHERKEWYDCACCPPNIARLLASLPGYFYSTSEEGIWVHLYAKSEAKIELENLTVNIIQETNYPWEGEVLIRVEPNEESTFSIFLRVPGWSKLATIKVGDEEKLVHETGKYIEIRRKWKQGDEIRINFHVEVEKIFSNENVKNNLCKVAIKRGPIIYCIESVDNPNLNIFNLSLPLDSELKTRWTANLLNGINIIEGEALYSELDNTKEKLYTSSYELTKSLSKVRFTAIPYYAWANRGKSDMLVWIKISKMFFNNLRSKEKQ
ncbi:MAG: glycoside hydrolase family 127 protein [Thermoproteota archaeon]|nr:glycoside hydrolase family 127 protein [Candidatus Brockarchaeota archaeon]